MIDDEAAAGSAPVLDLAGGHWTDRETTPAFRIHHRLADDERLQLDALAALADRLPDHLVETAPAEQPVVQADFRPAVWQGPSAGDLIRDVAARGRWVALSNIERDATYRTLVEDLIGEFRREFQLAAGDVFDPEGYAFVTPGPSRLPFHVDHEHNVFLQIRGRKRFSIGRYEHEEDRSRALEGMYSGEYGAARTHPVDVTTYELGPGDGLFVPPLAVHAVETPDDVSVSLSVVFRSPALQRAAHVYACNAHLRRLRLRPRPPGAGAARDQAKVAVVRAWHGARAVEGRLRRS